MRTILRAGTVITCEEGHEICDVIKDIHLYSRTSSTCLRNFRQKEPAIKPDDEVETTGLCTVCGSKWANAENGTVQIHTRDDGWWPDERDEHLTRQ